MTRNTILAAIAKIRDMADDEAAAAEEVVDAIATEGVDADEPATVAPLVPLTDLDSAIVDLLVTFSDLLNDGGEARNGRGHKTWFSSPHFTVQVTSRLAERYAPVRAEMAAKGAGKAFLERSRTWSNQRPATQPDAA